jgi:hypothetical protein
MSGYARLRYVRTCLARLSKARTGHDSFVKVKTV